MKEEAIELEGVVSEVLPSATFRVDLANGHRLIATAAGKIRDNGLPHWLADRLSQGR